MGETLRVTSAAEWRSWLEAHGADRSEIWVEIDRKGPAARTPSYAELLDEALCFGWIDGLVRGRDASTYLMRWTPRRPRSNWSAPNRARVRRLVAERRMAPPGLAALPDELRASLDS